MNLNCKKETFDHDCLSINWKGSDFNVFFVKKSDYNMIIMSTYSEIMVCKVQKEEY